METSIVVNIAWLHQALTWTHIISEHSSEGIIIRSEDISQQNKIENCIFNMKSLREAVPSHAGPLSGPLFKQWNILLSFV